jgi:hypothetical protein
LLNESQSRKKYQRYLEKEGTVTYIITLDTLNKRFKPVKDLRQRLIVHVTFQNYGATELLEWEAPGQPKNIFLKTDSMQYQFLNDSIISASKRTFHFDFERIVTNPGYHDQRLKIGCEKAMDKKLMGLNARKCYHLSWSPMANIRNRGTIIHYNGVPLELRYNRTIHYRTEVKAIRFSSAADSQRIDKLRSLTSSR